MKTETRSCVPRVPEKTVGLDGQEVVPDETMHTTPVPEPATITVIATV
jgi:hypothetical protein